MIDGGVAAHTIAVRLHFGAEFAHLHPTVVRVIFAKIRYRAYLAGRSLRTVALKKRALISDAGPNSDGRVGPLSTGWCYTHHFNLLAKLPS